MSGQTYRIGEAATLLNLKTYVLRFWEMEFPQIAPLRTEKGQRLYTEADLAALRRIRYLLHERGLTIEGARRILAEESQRSPAQQAQGSLLSVEENTGEEGGADESLDTLDQVLRAELSASEEPPTPIEPVTPAQPGLPLPLMREFVTELQDIRRLLNPEPERDV